jgi:Rrf2 family protein
MLSQKAKYAIKALMNLAVQEKGVLVKTADIAEQENIPKKFLELILIDLKRASLVASKQGIGGGYYLLRSADKISLADIYRLFDGAIALLPCASLRFYEPCKDCADENTCALRASLIAVRDQTLLALENTMLSQLVGQEKEVL